MKKLIIMAGAMLLSACGGINTETSGASKTVNQNFYQHWVHSYEEQNGDKVNHIFRPKGSMEFPATRFRMEFGFDPSGQCNYKFMSPDDRHEMRDCIYTKIGNKVFLYDDQGKHLSHLDFTLAGPAEKSAMRMSYGVKKPKEEKSAKKK